MIRKLIKLLQSVPDHIVRIFLRGQHINVHVLLHVLDELLRGFCQGIQLVGCQIHILPTLRKFSHNEIKDYHNSYCHRDHTGAVSTET